MKQSPKILGGAIAGSITCLFAFTAFADAPPSPSKFPVVIAIPRCVKAPAADLQRIVSAELGIDVATQQLDDDAASRDTSSDAQSITSEDPNVTRVTIACTGSWLRLQVLDPVSGKTLVRHLDLSAHDASTRTRLLGISAAELVAASWIELAARPSPQPHVVEAKASQSARDTAIHAAQRALAPSSFYRLEGVAAAQRTGSADLLTLGGGAGAGFVHNGWQVVGGDIVVESGNQDVPLGNIRTLLLSASASVRIRQRLGWMAVEGGLGARAGLAYMQGEAADIMPRPATDSATLPWWGPMILLRLEAVVAERVAFIVGLEAGRVIHAADGRAGGQTGSAIDNQWVGVTVGPAFTLGGAP